MTLRCEFTRWFGLVGLTNVPCSSIPGHRRAPSSICDFLPRNCDKVPPEMSQLASLVTEPCRRIWNSDFKSLDCKWVCEVLQTFNAVHGFVSPKVHHQTNAWMVYWNELFRYRQTSRSEEQGVRVAKARGVSSTRRYLNIVLIN